MMNSKLKRQQQQRPRLDRRNAIKNIDYDAGGSGFTLPSSSSNSSFEDRSVYKTRSLDLLPLSGRTSFRIEGTEGEVDEIFRYLGLGPEDFSIPVAAWEARKTLSPSSNNKTAKSADRSDFSDRENVNLDDVQVSVDKVSENEVKSKLISHGEWRIKGIGPSKLAPPPVITGSVLDNTLESGEFRDGIGARIKIGNGEAKDGTELISDSNEVMADEASENQVRSEFVSNDDWGIRGRRPPKLAPPPVMMRSVVDNMSSTWDIFKAFGPQDDQDSKLSRDVITHSIHEAEENKEVEGGDIGGRQEQSEDAVEKEREVGLDSFSESSNEANGGDSVFLIGENNYTVSPSGSFRLNIVSWQKGDFLGSGSFGTVYEGFTE